MSNTNDPRFDSYVKTFARGEEAELLAEVVTMEENSQWLTGIRSTDLELRALDGRPLFQDEDFGDLPVMTVKSAIGWGMDEDLTEETWATGMRLVLGTGRSYGLVRNTAYGGLCSTALSSGSACGKLLDKDPVDFAKYINLGFTVARDSSVALMRYGKISALHSNAEGGYAIMPISDLLKITMDVIDRRFGTGDFIGGSNTHGFTAARWMLPDAQQKLLEVYTKALNAAGGRTQYPINMMPVLRFSSSDTGSNCATLEPMFLVPKTNAPVRFTEGVRIRHSKRGGKEPMEAFREGAEDLFAKFEESAEAITRLASTWIYNGCNACVSFCNKVGIAKKYGEAARIEVERLAVGRNTITAHDLYLAMTEVLAEADRCDASETTKLNLDEALARFLKADWSEHDVGGTVAWK